MKLQQGSATRLVLQLQHCQTNKAVQGVALTVRLSIEKR
jgi:hypothetical protein